MMEKGKIKFGTSGWRGVLAEDFTFENVRIVAQAIAHQLLQEPKIKNGVLIGYDTRFMAEEFSWTVAQVFAGNGIHCYICQNPVPTPVISYTIRKRQFAGGINITASHNPFYWNGIKFNSDTGGPALPEITQKIEQEIENILNGQSAVKLMFHQDKNFKDFIHPINPEEGYFEEIYKKLDTTRIRQQKRKVCVDVVYGTGIDYLDALLRKLLPESSEKDLNVIHDFRDPYFGGYRPEPDKKRLEELGKVVLENRADLGLAVDGDSDRFGIVDDQGVAVSANEYLAIVAYHLYKNKGLKGDSARSVATSHAIDRVVSHYGFKTNVTPVGFKYIGDAIINQNIVLGGEESGGLSIQNHVPEKDGILACLLALELLAYEEKPLSRIRKEVEDTFGKFYNARIDVELESEAKKAEIMDFFRNVQNEVYGFTIKEKLPIDGFGFVLDILPDMATQGKDREGWILARASGTEPLVRIYIESTDREVFLRLKSEVEKIG